MVAWRSFDSTDPDELATILRPASGDIVATARGPYHARALHLDLEKLWLQRIEESTPRIWHVALPKHRAAVWFLTDAGPAASFQGMEAGAGAIGLCPVDQMVCQTLHGASAWGSMSLTVDEWARLSDIVERDLVVPRAGLAMVPRTDDMLRLQHLHRFVARTTRDAPATFDIPEVARCIEQSLIHALVECLRPADAPRHLPALRRLAIMRGLRRVMEETPDIALHVPDLCARLGVPDRTLRTVCHEYMGVGPKRYLQLRRLHQVRDALRKGQGAITVTDAATRFGFWELGRFAVEYKALFGESPSVTLRHAG